MRGFALLALAAIAVSVSGNAIDFELEELEYGTEEFLRALEEKVKESTWTVASNSLFEAPIAFVKKLMGVHKHSHLHRLPEKEIDDSYDYHRLPKNFDSRKEWSNCESINEIRNQGQCGSCWAFGAVEAMTDRYCIHSNGTKNFRFSAEDLVSCCSSCGSGCDGGYLGPAWQYWTQTGIVSGGAYDSKEGCQPYEISPDANEANTPKCHHRCEHGYHVSYRRDKHFGSDAYSIDQNVTHIQKEIFENGPVEGAFDVYSDFMAYSGGVYEHVQGGYLGGHAIKIIGWGVENKTPYWLVANSWGPEWGLSGFFKIRRGTNECNIETQITAGLPEY